MPARLNYEQLAPEGLAHMRSFEHYLNTASGLDHTLLELVRLRASLMNGCESCVHLHTAELRKLNQPEDRIAALPAWHASTLFTDRERAALVWTEAVTNIQEGHAPDEVYHALRQHFTEAETVNLTLAISTINGWNRLAIALGNFPGHAGAAGSAT